MRRIATYGEEITLRSVTVAIDDTSDWEDETYTESTTTARAITRDARQPSRERDELGDEIDLDLVLYIYENDLDGFTLHEYDDDGESWATVNGTEYRIVRVRGYTTGTFRVEAVRV